MNKDQMIEELAKAGQDRELLSVLSDEQISEQYKKRFPTKSANGLGKVHSFLAGRKGGLAGYEETVGSWTDSAIGAVDEAYVRTTKSGPNKGREYFVALASDGTNCCFDLSEAVQVQLDNKNIDLVNGDIETVNGVEGIKNAQLLKGSGVLLQKIDGVLTLQS
jgi:hypothetical protein